MVIAFLGDSWKMTKGVMVISYGKKECTLYILSDTNNSITVTFIGVDANTWHRNLGHMNEKGMKVMHLKRKLP